MVRIQKIAKLLALTAIASIVPWAPAAADDTLERLQAEVSAIVKSVKGAVVSIEDERQFAENVDLDKALAEANRELEKTMQGELKKLDKSEDAGGEKARRREEIRQKMRDAQKLSAEAIRKLVPLFAAGAPKTGTGFSIGDGLVVTTADVLEGMENPVVVTDAGIRIKVSVVGVDSDLNIGVLRLAPKAELPALRWGDSLRISVGHFGISIGNQNGQANSVSLNLVAGVRGDGTQAGSHFYPTLIQVAGTVGAGASGSPLINARGEVVGMMAAVPAGDWTEQRIPWMQEFKIDIPGVHIGPRRGTSGATFQSQRFRAVAGQPGAFTEIDSDDDQRPTMTFLRPPVTSAGFAIPSNDVRQVVEMLRGGKAIMRGWIGVITRNQTKYVQDGPYSRPICTVRVDHVVPGSPAARGGLEVGDILVSIDGKPIACTTEVRAISLRVKPGESLGIVYRRGGDAKKIDLKIDARPDNNEIKKHGPARKTTASAPASAGMIGYRVSVLSRC